MRFGFYILSCLPLVLLANEASAAPAKVYSGNGLPDVEINMDAIGAAPAATPVPAPAAAPVAQAVPAYVPLNNALAAPMPASAPAPLSQPIAAPAPLSQPIAAPAPMPVSQPVAAAPAVAYVHEPVMLNADGSMPAQEAAPSFGPNNTPLAGGVPATAGTPANGFVEVGGNYHTLSNNFGSWAGQYLKGEFQSDESNRWNGELLHEREFGESGYYGTVGNTHVIDPDWFTVIDLSGGTPTDASFLPRYRVDAFLNRKLLADRSLIATVGAGYSKAMRTYNDKDLYVGATYYFSAPWTAQVGYRFNSSSPGSVNSGSGFIAVTQGWDKNYFITGRYGYGKEAYQLIGPTSSLSDFNSQIYSLELRKWVIEDGGFDVRGEHYHNPSYDRDGINFGIFKEF